MPYANNQNVRIHYQVIGTGSPLVLHHAFAGSLDDYDGFGYVAALEDEYRLILIDARGHGASDKPHDPKAYRMESQVADVVAVLDDLGISKTHYLGYSMGGRVGFGIAKYARERLHSLLIGGAQPYERDTEDPDPWIPLLRKGMEATVAVYEKTRNVTPKRKARLLANDAEALVALRSVKERRGFEEILPTVTVPCLLYAGERDAICTEAKKASETIANGRFVSLPGIEHHGAYCQSDLVLPHIREFLAEMG
jgi:pimeloyl-ACP methyl ester carboxylesterase